MITKEQFVLLIEAMQIQQVKDINYANQLSDVFNTECSTYDNSVLYSSIINLLRSWFPKKDDHCEIEFYCFWQNFGRVETDDEVKIETAEEFYDRLLIEKED